MVQLGGNRLFVRSSCRGRSLVVAEFVNAGHEEDSTRLALFLTALLAVSDRKGLDSRDQTLPAETSMFRILASACNKISTPAQSHARHVVAEDRWELELRSPHTDLCQLGICSKSPKGPIARKDVELGRRGFTSVVGGANVGGISASLGNSPVAGRLRPNSTRIGKLVECDRCCTKFTPHSARLTRRIAMRIGRILSFRVLAKVLVGEHFCRRYPEQRTCSNPVLQEILHDDWRMLTSSANPIVP